MFGERTPLACGCNYAHRDFVFAIRRVSSGFVVSPCWTFAIWRSHSGVHSPRCICARSRLPAAPLPLLLRPADPKGVSAAVHAALID